MGSGSGVDLFSGFNEGEVSEVLRRCTNCGRFVLIGPPRSGKTFLIENHLRDKLGTSVTIEEHIPGIATTTKTRGEEAKGGLGLREKVMRYLEGLIPLIRRLREKVRVEDEELRRVLGDRAPRHVVEGARGMIGDSPHRAYYIPWDSDEVRRCMEEPSACAFGANVGKALKLIKEAFGDRRTRWFKAEYIPPGLVEEVVDLIREKGEGGAREVLEDWVNAYFEAIEALRKVLGLGEDLLEWDELSIGFLSNFVNNLASYVIGGLAAIPISAAALAIISVLTYIAFKREGEGYLREIIGLRRSLETLRVEKPGGGFDFNELGRLLVYRVAYAMGMSYDEAKKALMDITGLSIDELERRVNEIERKIEELEVKVNELNNWVNLLKQKPTANIIIAGKADFEQGIIYPNIKVENGELRIRVEDGYHSIVRVGKFNELANEVRGRLTSNGFVVVVGPKGIGKSTLAAAVIWELLMNGDIGLVARVDRLDAENYPKFVTFVENYGEKFGRLLILYDPVSTESYERVDIDVEAPMQTSIERTVKNLMKVVSSISPKASKPLTLIVIPSDFYNALSGEVRNAVEGYRLDVSQALSNREFLAELIREYTRTRDKPNGCELSNDVFSKLADEVAGFDSGHALIARLVGEELARNNCGVGKVEELINNAKGKAEAFIILHINGLFKIHENPNTAKALVEIFALRKPFVDSARPSVPILTPGIIELISEKRGASLLQSAKGEELRSWLVRRQHDLIEEAIKKLLICIVNRSKECEKLGDALNPWKTIGVMETLSEVSEKVSDVGSAVKYFASNYGGDLTGALRSFGNCWKRAALIIGHALAEHDSVPGPEDLPKDLLEDAKYLSDALNRCEIDDYLLVGNKIPPLITNLVINNAHILTKAFVDKYDDAINEVNEILENARDRYVVKHKLIYQEESIYGLGLVSIIAKAAELGRPIKPSDADAALRIVFTAFISPDYVKPVLHVLEPLRNKAPHRYLELQVSSLMRAMDDYISQLSRYGREDVVDKIFDLLNELDKLSPNLGVIAWAHVLTPTLENENVRLLIERKLDNKNVIDKTNEILEKLSKLKEKVWELMMDEVFVSYVESRELMKNEGVMGYVKFRPVKADEEAVRRTILEEISSLKHKLAYYKFRNDVLDDAARLFNEAAEVAKEIKEVKCFEVRFEDYLINRSWALRTEAIKSSLSDNELTKLVNEYRQLFEDIFKRPTAEYLSIAPKVLGEYLVSLALMGSDKEVEVKEISELLKEHWQVLNNDEEVSVLTRLTLDALLSPKGGLSIELWNRLIVKPWELIKVFGYQMLPEFLTALKIIFGVRVPDDEIELCRNDDDCRDPLLAIEENDDAVKQKIRDRLINAFRKRISEKEVLDLLKGLGINDNELLKMFNEFESLVNGLDGASLVELISPIDPRAQLALMLYALVNGNKELAKAHALMGAVYATDKPSARLFLEAYRACCDLKNSEEFRRAIAKLFLYHV